MNIDYFMRKQTIILSKLSVTYVRDKYFNQLSRNDRLVALIGARGVGKTTVILQYLKSLDVKSIYVTGDDIEFTNSSLYEIADEFYALEGRVICIDEVHKYKNWAQEIKNIYDSFPDMTIRISGSSMLNIIYEKYDLSRRLVICKMDTLSFKEYVEIQKGIKLQSYRFDEILNSAVKISSDLVLKYQDIYALFKEYLKHGAYPFYLEGLESFDQKLYNAMDKIIHEDIPSLNKIDYSHISLFQKMIFYVVFAKKPFSVNVAALSREFGVTEPTLYTYLSILDKTGIFRSMRKYSKNISKKPQKLLFSNTNILYSYSNDLNIEVDIGTVRETFFANCFKDIYYSDIGDFKVEEYVFEVGGKNKNFAQVKDVDKSFLALDIDFTTNDKKIPLWLFGFII
ncbi:MAG: ATP-binding protein [Campylobacterales bacterium]|nr:ATP-binding protein [Campylobacterales bacterium]